MFSNLVTYCDEMTSRFYNSIHYIQRRPCMASDNPRGCTWRPKFTEETLSMFYLCVTDSSTFTWPMRFKILTRAAFLYFLLEMHGRRPLIFTKTCPQNCSNMDASCKWSQSNVNPGALTELSDSRM